MTPTLHIVANCTDRKRIKPASKMRLRAIPQVPVRERVDLWRDTVRTSGSEKVAARDLYCGEHWSVVSRLPDAAREAGFSPQLWIASAGHGLVSGDSMIASYSATFSPGHPDTTCNGSERSPDSWWQELAAARRSDIRRISDLAGESSKAHVLVVCSAAYVSGLEADLIKAASEAEGRLLLVSSAYKRTLEAPEPLDAVMLKAEAPLRQRFGGSLTGLNARLALEILGTIEHGGWEIERLRRRVRDLIAGCPALPRIRRAECDDAGIEKYIKSALRASPSTWTRLLRSFREEGNACEQSRFRKLFRRVERAL
jgi:hypothetical protein